MPSDERVRAALSATEGPRRDFLSSVRTTADQVDAFLRARKGKTHHVSEQVAESLGGFAAGRIDASKFSAFLPARDELPPTLVDAMERAGGALREVARLRDEDFVVQAESGESMSEAARRGLGRLGRAFGAAEMVEAIRSGRTPDKTAEGKLTRYDPDDWTSRERQLAPPVVVLARGESLRGAQMRDWLEGMQQIVVVADGPCPPAPMVSLLSPGVLVGQVHSIAALEVMDQFDGPAAVAIVASESASWMHDPRRTPPLEIHSKPAAPPQSAVGPISPWRQEQDLAHLERIGAPLAGARPATGNGTGTPEEVAPADRLAAWLLKQADVGSD